MRTSRSSRRQMLSRVHLLVLLLSVACGPGLAATQALHASSVGSVPHILVVLEENRSYDEVIGNSAWPQLNALAQANGLATNYFAVAHPSLPNYLALLSGSTQGVTDDGDYTFPGPAFPDELSNAGISWRA